MINKNRKMLNTTIRKRRPNYNELSHHITSILIIKNADYKEEIQCAVRYAEKIENSYIHVGNIKQFSFITESLFQNIYPSMFHF